MKNNINWTHIFFSITCMLLNGFAIMNLWNWFIMPLGVINIGFAHALGIDVLITLIVMVEVPKKIEEFEDIVRNIIYINLLPIWALILGFIIKCFM